MNIPSRPRVKDFKAVEFLKDKTFHFQYPFDTPNIKPRYENMLVSEDIAKEINKASKHQNEFSVCELAPLDGYFIWRLSQLQKRKKFNLKLNALEIQTNNCRKIKLVGDAFGYEAVAHVLPIEQFSDGLFDFFTMLGVTYQLPQTLKTLEHIIQNLLKTDSFFYFDFIHPGDNFSKDAFHENGTTNEEGLTGTKFILADERTEEDNAYYLNHPTSAVSTILYTKDLLAQFFLKYKYIQLQTMSRSVSPTYEWVTYRAHIKK